MKCSLEIDNKGIKSKVLLGHGSGGDLTHQLIKKIFKKYFTDPLLAEEHDSVPIDLQLNCNEVPIMSTDSFVMKPLFVKNSNIGSLSVIGTINDLVMSGATPLYLSVAFIIEEGFDFESLELIASEMAQAAHENNVRIVCGDTKVVERGHGDGVYITTTGIGKVLMQNRLSPSKIKEGDLIFVSGDIGRHGMAVMAERENLSFESSIQSDCGSLLSLYKNLYDNSISIHCMRDLSRGGLVSSLVELAETSNLDFELIESQVPVSESVRSACEILGLDPFYVANEGTCVLMISKSEAAKIELLKSKIDLFANLTFIGEVLNNDQTSSMNLLPLSKSMGGSVYLKTLYGVHRKLYRLSGEQLPRIC